MKGKLISFGLLASIVIGAGFIVDQLKTSGAHTRISAANDSDYYATSQVRVNNQTFDVELSVTSEQKALGLGKRDQLATGKGMLFVFKPAEEAVFWMRDMRFALDIVWIRDNKIVSISRQVQPPLATTQPQDLPTYSPHQEVDYVLEINAGEASTLMIGDRVEIVDSQSV